MILVNGQSTMTRKKRTVVLEVHTLLDTANRISIAISKQMHATYSLSRQHQR